MAKKISNESLKLDGLTNIVTAVGVAGKDKRAATKFSDRILVKDEIQAAFKTNALIKRIVKKLPDEMTRDGFVVKKTSDAYAEFIRKEFMRLSLEQELTQAMTIGRLYGGGVLYFFFDDGAKQEEPLEIEKIKGIKFARCFDRHELSSTDVNRDVFSPNFRNPDFYTVNSGGSSLKIHHSRVIRFDGAWLPWSMRENNQYWHESVLSEVYDSVIGYDGALDNTRSLLEDMRIKIIKLAGLVELLQAGKLSLVKQRLELFDYQSSIIKACILQGGENGDEFENKTLSFASIPEVIDRLKERLIAASGMPHTKLFGTGPDGGIGATGNSEIRDWYDYVASEREISYRPPLEKILTWMTVYGPEKNAKPEVSFPPLWQPTEKEIAETRKINSETDKNYYDIGVLDEDEIADSRYGSGEYSSETKINGKTRRKLESTEQKSSPSDDDA